MKKRLPILLICLVLIPVCAWADFAESSTVFDPELARYAMKIAELCYSPAMQESVLAVGGYRRIGVFNADRAEEDERHVATYAVYDRTNEKGTVEVIIAIRGTGRGEWKLNMELMPSGNYDLPYAENFALAAEDILNTQADYLASLSSPAFLITGYSRGAAVANILGARLSERFGEENVFAYTFATPRTVRGEFEPHGNIFNIVNPADLVTYLPFPQWGFKRYGVDIELPVENPAMLEAAKTAYAARSDRSGSFPSFDGAVETTQRVVSEMAELAPDPRSAYTLSHARTHPGEADGEEEGVTAGQFLLTILEGGISHFQSSAGSEAAALTENDFTPLLQILQSASSDGSLSNMHMPAVYGAWMAAMEP